MINLKICFFWKKGKISNSFLRILYECLSPITLIIIITKSSKFIGNLQKKILRIEKKKMEKIKNENKKKKEQLPPEEEDQGFNNQATRVKKKKRLAI